MLTIDLIYTCKVSLINVSRVNQLQTLTIDASLCDPPKLVVDKDRQVSDNGRRKATNEYGRWYEGKVRTPWVTNAERLYWREFYESVAGEEPFTFDATGFWGFDSDTQALTVFMTDSSFSTPRLDLLNAYSSEFSWREVET